MSYTLDSLKTEIQNLQEDTFTDFTRDLPGIIERAEIRLYLDMGLELADKVGTVVINASNPKLFTITENHVALNSVSVVNCNGATRHLSLRSSGYMRMTSDSFVDSGSPTYYGTSPENSVSVDPAYTKPAYIVGPVGLASAVGTLLAIIRVVPETLIGKPAGTWLSTNVPDLLLAGCLVEVERRNKNPETQMLRDQEYQRLFLEWNGYTTPQHKRDGHNAQQGIG